MLDRIVTVGQFLAQENIPFAGFACDFVVKNWHRFIQMRLTSASSAYRDPPVSACNGQSSSTHRIQYIYRASNPVKSPCVWVDLGRSSSNKIVFRRTNQSESINETIFDKN